MKIGFSLGMCVADIVQNRVAYNDVLFIISGTAIKTRPELSQIKESYAGRPNYWLGLDADKCLDICYQLWDGHKLLQPRLQDIYRYGVPKDCIWADMMPSPVKNNSALQSAWDNYRLLVDLTGDVPSEVQEYWKRDQL
jgi:hypothetical protein